MKVVHLFKVKMAKNGAHALSSQEKKWPPKAGVALTPKSKLTAIGCPLMDIRVGEVDHLSPTRLLHCPRALEPENA